ncbi:hypothetical protein [Staphylococcus aureus]|uniref:hypothetical protein n=1 Tax=Staphylococcus aureus TaxID=1280 RepID=UPI000676315E|nr:hypothetical protein [Staphylococcus aureus]HCW3604046.1 hypothetical protein [Staphylococcus aureus]HCW3606208.1 hypothetical protein [Staphylococcus aureus]
MSLSLVFSRWRYGIVVLWRFEIVILWRFQNGVSIKKSQQDLDLTVTYTFHNYISDCFYSYK